MPSRSLCAFLISLLTFTNPNSLFSQNQPPTFMRRCVRKPAGGGNFYD